MLVRLWTTGKDGVTVKEASFRGYHPVDIPVDSFVSVYEYAGRMFFTNDCDIKFPTCTGKSQTITHFSIGSGSPRRLNDRREVTKGAQMQFSAGSIQMEATFTDVDLDD